jgi:hypothetical protein
MMDKYLSCFECPHCKKKGAYHGPFQAADGVEYGICGYGGNTVFLEPWKENRIYGSGYIYHKPNGCGMVLKEEIERVEE